MAVELEALGRAIKQAQYRHHRAMDTRLAGAGTTLVQWDALRAIDQLPGSSAHDLALQTFQTDQAFGTLANRLAGQGLIERTPGRGRRIEHRLTATGSAVLEAGHLAAADVLGSSFAQLSEEERSVLLGLLQRVAGQESVPD